MLDTNPRLTNLKFRSIVSARMTWVVMTIVVDAAVASVVEAVVEMDVAPLRTVVVVTDVDQAWITAALKEDVHQWVTMAKKAAIVDAEDVVVEDSAVAIKEEWTVRKRRTAIEAIQADMVSVAVTPNNARTMEASTLAAKDSDNVVMTAIATMAVDVEAVVEEEVPGVLDPGMMTVDIKITVAHATTAATNVGVVAMVTTAEVEVVAVAVAASTIAVAVVVASIKAVEAVAATMAVISSEHLSPRWTELSQVPTDKLSESK